MASTLQYVKTLMAFLPRKLECCVGKEIINYKAYRDTCSTLFIPSFTKIHQFVKVLLEGELRIQGRPSFFKRRRRIGWICDVFFPSEASSYTGKPERTINQ
jgi:hypothetical protein